MSKLVGAFAAIALVAAAAVPSLAGADSNALLSVYVQVTNPSSYFNYGYGTVVSHNSGDFNVIVAGQSPSPSSFSGSDTGTQVSLGSGSYSVAVTGTQYGYTPSYSQGCTGTLGAGQTGLCIITMNPQYVSYPYPTPYPYPYNYTPALSCAPSNQTVGLNQSVSFQAVGGAGGTYNWTVPGRNFPNVGPVLTTSFDGSGSQLVTVTNGSQSATCQVDVTNTYYPTPTSYNPYYPNTYSGAYPNTVYPYGYTNNTYGCTSCTNYVPPCTSCTTSYTAPYVTNTYYPRLPNTGFEPLTAVQLAFALTLLSGVALIAMPYVRKAFAVAVR